SQMGLWGGCILALTAPAFGSPLNLHLNPTGDVTSGYTDVVYHASTSQFTASGFALTLHNGSNPAPSITNGGFHLTATVDHSGHATAGTVSLAGSVTGYGPTLVTGTLSNFGSTFAGGGMFEFLFTVTGGDLASPFYN